MNEPPTSPANRISLFGRLLLSIAFGVLIATMTLFAGLQQANRQGSVRHILFRQRATIHDLRDLRDEILVTQAKTHRLPDSIAFSTKGYSDSWGYPLHYFVHGTEFQLISYGSDGKPGGTGLAADLTADSNATSDSYRLTMRDFLTLPDTREMVEVGIGTGLLSAFLCFFVTQTPKSEQSYKIPVGWRVLLVFGAATCVGSIITALHVPTGH